MPNEIISACDLSYFWNKDFVEFLKRSCFSSSETCYLLEPLLNGIYVIKELLYELQIEPVYFEIEMD